MASKKKFLVPGLVLDKGRSAWVKPTSDYKPLTPVSPKRDKAPSHDPEFCLGFVEGNIDDPSLTDLINIMRTGDSDKARRAFEGIASKEALPNCSEEVEFDGEVFQNATAPNLWWPEWDDFALTKHADGRSYAQIARGLKAQFGVEKTKNGVKNRIARLKKKRA